MLGSVFFVTTLLWSYSNACQTPTGATSSCVSLYDCPPLMAAFQQRPLPTNVVNYLRQSQCGFTGSVPKVCCGPIPAQQSTDSSTQPQPAGPKQVVGRVEDYSSEDSSPAPANQCGIDTNGDRIYGGERTDLDEFPWMALMGYRRRNGSLTYQCGGVLINRRYVLTAAHCITGAIQTQVGTLVTVRLGEYDTSTDVDCIEDVCADKPQDIPVISAYAHPGYSDRNVNRKDDIGIARLATRARYTYYVQPICLVNARDRLATGYDVYVAGWGKTRDEKSSPIKLKLSLPIFEKTDCVTKYRTLGAELTDNHLCAGGIFNQDACRGDSGGPLMRTKPNGVWEIVGVVSFGHGCGRDGWPGVYTDVAKYRDWIQTTLQSTNV